eukprot:CAMPEP_0198534386 /NCGR_PEP_ID=MMETSP1462-20131121/36424_1 /TAXON_ID=1333877 /ORGANISM="Brandtodinium nutriculum, Strain RCC3387" /LENGTH=124 /DNA_ID=CAMNT_0044264309 /DNA_START=57 /DNA_END=426 /DNA_ORIENTATION=+
MAPAVPHMKFVATTSLRTASCLVRTTFEAGLASSSSNFLDRTARLSPLSILLVVDVQHGRHAKEACALEQAQPPLADAQFVLQDRDVGRHDDVGSHRSEHSVHDAPSGTNGRGAWRPPQSAARR